MFNLIYKVTAEIVSARDDAHTATEEGTLQIIILDDGTVITTAVFGDRAAQVEGTAPSFNELADQAVWAATIGSGTAPGCQLGQVLYQGIAAPRYEAGRICAAARA